MHVARSDEAGFTLVEMTVVAAVLIVVLVIVMSFVVSANNSVSAGTARAADESAASAAADLLDANVRFASNMSISPDGTTLSVVATQPVCTVWTVAGGNLTEQTSRVSTAVIARGVSAAGQPFTGNANYQALVTVSFSVTLPGNGTRDSAGSPVLETLSAQNMTVPVANSAIPVCRP